MTEQLSSFIASTFRSVWALEVLLLLKKEPGPWKHDALVSSLRASDLVVSQAVAALAAGGLIHADESGATYHPVSPRVADLVDQTENAYALKPDAVRRIIVTASSSGIAAFADAFRLCKD